VPRPTATIDSTCLIALESLDLLPKLSVLFDRVWIPKAVREETAKRHRRKQRITAIINRYAFYERCEVADQVRVELLLTGGVRSSQPKRHRGEAEAVIQATERGATTVLVDDPDGRGWAHSHRLECHGTIWVLRELRRIGVIPALEPMFRRLKRAGHRLPKPEINAVLRDFGED
jgi:predicted nucleic acid-binding protein